MFIAGFWSGTGLLLSLWTAAVLFNVACAQFGRAIAGNGKKSGSPPPPPEAGTVKSSDNSGTACLMCLVFAGLAGAGAFSLRSTVEPETLKWILIVCAILVGLVGMAVLGGDSEEGKENRLKGAALGCSVCATILLVVGFSIGAWVVGAGVSDSESSTPSNSFPADNSSPSNNENKDNAITEAEAKVRELEELSKRLSSKSKRTAEVVSDFEKQLKDYHSKVAQRLAEIGADSPTNRGAIDDKRCAALVAAVREVLASIAGLRAHKEKLDENVFIAEEKIAALKRRLAISSTGVSREFLAELDVLVRDSKSELSKADTAFSGGTVSDQAVNDWFAKKPN